MRRVLGLAVGLAVAGAGLASVASAQEPDAGPVCGPRPPPIPAYPESLPAPPDPPPYDPSGGMGTTLDLGVAAVAPAEEPLAAGEPDRGRLAAVEFPLFVAPGGALAGWVVHGWWVDAGPTPPRRLTTEPMVETGYETASWIALEEGAGGWVRLRLLAAGDTARAGSDGTAWALACHLSASDPPLVVRRWEETLAEPGPVFFRTTSAHALRTGPGIRHALRFWIRGDDHDAMLEPLERRGDWMRVRVTRPSTYCVTDPPADVRVDEGWIRWRDGEMGPWVWTFTRGC